MTNKNSTKLLFKTYRQPITVINLTEANFNQGKDCLRATEIRKGQRSLTVKKQHSYAKQKIRLILML